MCVCVCGQNEKAVIDCGYEKRNKVEYFSTLKSSNDNHKF